MHFNPLATGEVYTRHSLGVFQRLTPYKYGRIPIIHRNNLLGHYSLRSSSNNRFFKKLFMSISSAERLLNGTHRKKYDVQSLVDRSGKSSSLYNKSWKLTHEMKDNHFLLLRATTSVEVMRRNAESFSIAT